MKQPLFLVILLLSLWTPMALAHQLSESHSWTELREWTESDGTRHVGSFLLLRDRMVRIEDPNGNTFLLSIDKLNSQDREYVLRRAAKLQSLNSPAKPEQLPAGGAFYPVLLSIIAMVLLFPLARRIPFLPRYLIWAGIFLLCLAGVGLRQQAQTMSQPAIAEAFARFAPKVKTHWDNQFLYVESDGLPEHQMMVGIRSWQQQVPLPQPYQGANAWTIPLKPVLSSHPVSAKNSLYRGAIALAVNGVPIFNALNNRGEDAYLAGELDEWGGHCGRADDYHYHMAPLHLQKQIGNKLPIAMALDGFPLYGLTEPDGSPVRPLDEFNGHTDQQDKYHYHSSRTYPYINGGMRGEVTVRDDQVDPQPRAAPVREFLQPLRGAVITGFKASSPGSWELTYRIRTSEQRVAYSMDKDGKALFRFIGADGRETTEMYQRREPGRRSQPPPRDGRPQDDRQAQDRPRRNPDGPGGRRQPWIVVHAAELDLDHDGVITWTEMVSEIQSTFQEFDRDRNGKLTATETANARGIRHPLAGFISQHSSELDLDGDGTISLDEVMKNVRRMFDRADTNHDGRLTRDELATDQ